MDGRETPYSGLRDPPWLAGGWREYSFELTTVGLPTDTFRLPVSTASIRETDTAHYVDDRSVHMGAQ